MIAFFSKTIFKHENRIYTIYQFTLFYPVAACPNYVTLISKYDFDRFTVVKKPEQTDPYRLSFS